MSQDEPRAPGAMTEAQRKAERLRTALRENLKRRKAQARGRASVDPAPMGMARSDPAVGAGTAADEPAAQTPASHGGDSAASGKDRR